MVVKAIGQIDTPTVRPWLSGTMETDQPLKDLLSLVTVTHYSPRESYGELSPPSSGLVEKTIHSFREGIAGLEDCNHYIVYNEPGTDEDCRGPETYRKHLRKLAETTENVSLLTRENQGLGPGILEGLKHVDTPLVLFVEHDWELLQSIEVQGVLETFESHEEVQSIRFNKRSNTESLWDTIVLEDDTKAVPLCKVSSVGNHPQIVRTEQLHEWIKRSEPTLPTVLKGFWYHYSTPQSAINYGKALFERYVRRADVVRKFDDVEFVLDTKYKSDIKRLGFEDAHSKWGVYLYGSRGGGPYIQHLGR